MQERKQEEREGLRKSQEQRQSEPRQERRLGLRPATLPLRPKAAGLAGGAEEGPDSRLRACPRSGPGRGASPAARGALRPVTQSFAPRPAPPRPPLATPQTRWPALRWPRPDPVIRPPGEGPYSSPPQSRGGPESEEEEGDEDNERRGGGGRGGRRGGRPTRWPLLQEQPQQQQVGGWRRRWRWQPRPWPGGLGQSQNRWWQRRRRRLPRRWRRPQGLGAERSCCSDQRGYISHYVLTVSTEDILKKDKLFSKILIPVESLL